MQKVSTNIIQAASVTTMAQRVGLSRSRFYQLMDLGIFPKPLRHPRTKRPYFNQEQQAQCEVAKATGCGVNGEPVLFATTYKKPKKSEDVSNATSSHLDGTICSIVDEIVHGLIGLGKPDVSRDLIKTALDETYPDGYAEVDASLLLTTVYRWLRRRENV